MRDCAAMLAPKGEALSRAAAARDETKSRSDCADTPRFGISQRAPDLNASFSSFEDARVATRVVAKLEVLLRVGNDLAVARVIDGFNADDLRNERGRVRVQVFE